MKHRNILFATLLAVSLTVLCASSAAPKKKFKYDGLILCPTTEHVFDWDRIAADKDVKYVYFEIPYPMCDTALLRENVAEARSHGLKTGMCFDFTDSLQKVTPLFEHFRSVPKDLSQISPMISVPEGSSFERSVIHKWIQIWGNVIKSIYGEQPILKANREDCKDYLAPVLTSTYRICLVFPEAGGSYMIQNPAPISTYDPAVIAYPCLTVPD